MANSVFAVTGKYSPLIDFIKASALSNQYSLFASEDASKANSIIVSVLLAFLTQTLGDEGDRAALKRMRIQVWCGVGLGLFLCLCVGAGMMGAFHGLEKDTFTNTEDIWEESSTSSHRSSFRS